MLVPQHGGLGHAGGAAGVQQHRDALGIHVPLGGGRLGAIDEGEEVVARQRLDAVDVEELRQRLLFAHRDRRGNLGRQPP